MNENALYTIYNTDGMTGMGKKRPVYVNTRAFRITVSDYSISTNFSIIFSRDFAATFSPDLK